MVKVYGCNAHMLLVSKYINNISFINSNFFLYIQFSHVIKKIFYIFKTFPYIHKIFSFLNSEASL